MKPKIIAFCGPPGAGKSTIIRAIKSLQPAYQSVDYDDFPNATHRSFEDIKTWFARGADPNEFILAELVTYLDSLSRNAATAKSASAILFETPFGPLHRRTGAFIDYLVWIDIPFDIALARQILKFNQRRSHRDETNGFTTWLDSYLRNYIDAIAAMYRRQASDIRAQADLQIDGLQTPAFLANLVLTAMAK
jgi:uridine kinase